MMEIRPADLRIDYFSDGFRNLGPIRIAHLPTGIVVEGSTKREAYEKLQKALDAHEAKLK
jgi:protein subunit release factor A